MTTSKIKMDVKNEDFIGSRNFYFLLLTIEILVVSFVRLRLSGMPLERDEGEYAYFGKLILQGITPYSQAYNMKLPGTYYMYSLIMMIFGQTCKGIHIGFLIMNAVTMILLFNTFKSFFNNMIALLTSGIYGLMALSYNVLGNAAHATHFVVFFVVLSLFFFSKYENKRTLLYAVLSGAMMGFAFLMKQQAFYFILFGGITFLVFQYLNKPSRLSNLILNISTYSFAVFVPYLIVLLIMFVTGNFDKFWFWTFQYAEKYSTGISWKEGTEMFEMFFTPIWNEFIWIWILAIAGLVILFISNFTIKQKILTSGFLLFAFLSTTPGLYFRPHYFVVLFPAIALLAAISLEYLAVILSKKINKKLVYFIIPIFFLLFIYANTMAKTNMYYLTDNPKKLCKTIYGQNPFVEAVEIGKYIKQNSQANDQIAVLGSEPEICFYADRKSATGYIYTYAMMEINEYNFKMQNEMIAEIETAKPEYMVVCNVLFSWLKKPNSPTRIFDWLNEYSQKYYNVVGIVEISSQDHDNYFWYENANRKPQSSEYILVFKRKD